MADQQRTFGETVGLDPVIPSELHRDDLVLCQDTGALMHHTECHYSVDGEAFEDVSERNDHDRDALSEFFDGVIQSSDDYRSSGDCAEEYGFLIHENPDHMREQVAEYVKWECNDLDDADNYPKDFLKDVCEDLLDHIETDVSHGCFGSSNHDVTFDSFDCGEAEEQVDLSCSELLMELHERKDSGNLNDLLDELERKFCFQRPSRWDKVTEKRIEGKIVENDCITLFNNTDIWYHFGCSEETLREVWAEHTEKVDYRLYSLLDRYVAHQFYNGPHDLDGPSALAEVIKANGGEGLAKLIDHADFPSLIESKHLALVCALRDILGTAKDEDRKSLAEWAQDALDDAELDYEDRWGENGRMR